MLPIRYRTFTPDFFFRPERFFVRALQPWVNEGPAESALWFPAVDVSENDHEVTIKADLPDVDQKDINLQIHDGQMVLKGERKFEKEEKKENYYHVERRFGNFERTFTMPAGADPDKVTAEYDKGVLTVHVPKPEAAKPRQIEIGAQK